MARQGKRIEARRGTEELLEHFRDVQSEQELAEVEAQAATIRRSYGDWSVRQHCEQLGLLEAALSKAEVLPYLAVRLMCFTIDNHNDEDEVRCTFQRRFDTIFQDVFVPRRRLGNRELRTSQITAI
jgi:hypothetical protein